MNKFLQKDKKNRNILKEYELKRFILKSIIKNFYFSNMIRWNAVLLLTNLPNASSEIKIVHRCILNGNKKRFNNLYNYSRMVFLKLIRSGYITGFRKSSW